MPDAAFRLAGKRQNLGPIPPFRNTLNQGLPLGPRAGIVSQFVQAPRHRDFRRVGAGFPEISCYSHYPVYLHLTRVLLHAYAPLCNALERSAPFTNHWEPSRHVAKRAAAAMTRQGRTPRVAWPVDLVPQCCNRCAPPPRQPGPPVLFPNFDIPGCNCLLLCQRRPHQPRKKCL